MQFASSDECQTILIKAFQVRQSWSRLMEKILNGKFTLFGLMANFLGRSFGKERRR